MVPARDQLLEMDDAELMGCCELSSFRASGPGGQHRNTTDSAVRLVLRGTAIAVTATDSRSQHRNRASALRKLRLAIALEMRDPASAWDDGWDIGRRDRRYPRMVAALFDALHEHEFQVSDAARSLGLSTGRLVRQLAGDTDLWARVNRERQARNLGLLRMP